MTGFSDESTTRRRARNASVGDPAQLQALVEAGRALLNAPERPMEHSGGTSVAELRRRFAHMQDSMAQFADVAGAQAQRIAGVADTHVRESPWAATAAALAIGFVLGRLVTDRR